MYLLSSITDETIAVSQWGVVISASLYAAFCDLRTRRIPNALTGSLLAVGLIFATCFGGLAGLANAVGACILLALPFVLLFIFAGGGAGDAKLMGAIGAWIGLTQGITVLICVLIAGGILAIAKSIALRRLKFVLLNMFTSIYCFMLQLFTHKSIRQLTYRTDYKQSDRLFIPYGVAIVAGVCAAAGITWIWGVEWLW